MKKKKYYLVLLMLVFAVVFCGCTDQSDSTAQQNEESTPSSVSTEKENNKSNNYEDFTDKLVKNNLLPSSIIDDMDDNRKDINDDGSVLYIWSSWDKEKNDYKHNIQLVVENNKITDYKYKNYYFDDSAQSKPIAKKEAADMATKFYQTFINKDDSLVFENDPKKQIEDMYDPGHVETWSAKFNGHDYYIVVDLDLGGVTLFSVNENS